MSDPGSLGPLLPSPPPPGAYRRLAPPPGAALAAGLAQTARALASQRRMLLVICAEALQAHTLAAEIAWFDPALQVREFADWETLPYDHFSPHPDLVSERMQALFALAQGQCDVLLVAATTLAQKLPPRSYIASRSFALARGDRIGRERLREQLVIGGYQHVTQVMSPGEFAVRGGIFDFFPLGAALPVRLDLFDDEIESLKHFEPDSQRTLYPIERLDLLPAREFPTDEAARTLFRQRFRESFEGDPARASVYKDVSNGIFPGGIEFYLPLFFDTVETLFEHLPADPLLCVIGKVYDTLGAFEKETRERWALLRGDPSRPLLPPESLYLTRDELMGRLKAYARYEIGRGDAEPLRLDVVAPAPDVGIDRQAQHPLAKLGALLDQTLARVLLVAESPGRAQTLHDLLAPGGHEPTRLEHWADFLGSSVRFALTTGPLLAGAHFREAGLIILTESELYPSIPRTARRRRGKTSDIDSMLRDLTELKVGDPVVHEEHGIGRYLGLISLDLGEGPTEFLHLEYAQQAKLYVPVANLHLISRYSGTSPEHAPLHTLGSGQWEKVKRRAAMQARDTAVELLNLYAQRAAREGHAFRIDWSEYAEFAAGFGFEETPDQSAAIQAVIQDMVAAKPMDRLVCGDVGFGKTEVALRAAFVAVMAGRQVAVLVPTTLLAEQHFQTFRDRFAPWPVRIEELSRFRAKKEVAATLEALAEGKVDLVIGTHKLIQPEVRFKNLGLVIIDEEHRFGVRQKEQLRRLRAEVDVLTLTATPIPRTLAMSLEGIRDFSVIATAPQKRLAIKTFVTRASDGIIREAILRELKRGGQVYFLHNEIDTIENMRERLEALVPEARIRVGHGQMGAHELEAVMRDFYQQRFQILLCSTIIETGIDVASANTILINRADKFGLAQLHQLRGRVGRSHHQAYAYLLIPSPEAITADAKKRLEAITQLEDLGSGFYLSMHDLEIRGAGEILGDEQSGEMQQVGFALYSEMLNQAVKALKAGREPDLDAPLGVVTEVNLHVPALLPEDYCPGIHERLVLYKRLANCESQERLTDLKEELIDRFGALPEQGEALLAAHELRILGKPLGVKKIDAAPERAIISFVPKPSFEPLRLIQMIQRDGRIRLAGQDRVRIERATPSLENRKNMLKEFLWGLT